MIEATIEGNVLTAPTQKMVVVGVEQVKVTELRVMSDVWKRSGDELVQDADKTSPVGITVWNERLGDSLMKLIRPGMRIAAVGQLHLDTWDAKEPGKEGGAEMRLAAQDVTLKLNRVEGIVMRPKADALAATENAAG